MKKLVLYLAIIITSSILYNKIGLGWGTLQHLLLVLVAAAWLTSSHEAQMNKELFDTADNILCQHNSRRA